MVHVRFGKGYFHLEKMRLLNDRCSLLAMILDSHYIRLEMVLDTRYGLREMMRILDARCIRLDMILDSHYIHLERMRKRIRLGCPADCMKRDDLEIVQVTVDHP